MVAVISGSLGIKERKLQTHWQRQQLSWWWKEGSLPASHLADTVKKQQKKSFLGAG